MVITTKQNRNYKGQVLKELFFQKYDSTNPQGFIFISIEEVIATADKYGKRPGNIHNFFKDIARSGKMPRSLREIEELGYFIRQGDRGGEFFKIDRTAESVSDLIDAVIIPSDIVPIEIDVNRIPENVLDLVRDDEGGVLSVVEYCKMLDVIAGEPVYRVQSPVKVARNEIDGLYVFGGSSSRILFSAEVKSKGTDVLLKHQIYGAANKAMEYFGSKVTTIIPLGIKIAKDNTVCVVVFEQFAEENRTPSIKEYFRFVLSTTPPGWTRRFAGRIKNLAGSSG